MNLDISTRTQTDRVRTNMTANLGLFGFFVDGGGAKAGRLLPFSTRFVSDIDFVNARLEGGK